MAAARDHAETDPGTRIGRFEAARAEHLKAARRALTRARDLIDGLLGNWNPDEPVILAAAARRIADAAAEGRAQADMYAAGYGVRPVDVGGVQGDAPPAVDYVGVGIIAGWLRYEDVADLKQKMARKPGWPAESARILPGRHGPDRGWLPESRKAWEAWDDAAAGE